MRATLPVSETDRALSSSFSEEPARAEESARVLSTQVAPSQSISVEAASPAAPIESIEEITPTAAPIAPEEFNEAAVEYSAAPEVVEAQTEVEESPEDLEILALETELKETTSGTFEAIVEAATDSTHNEPIQDFEAPATEELASETPIELTTEATTEIVSEAQLTEQTLEHSDFTITEVAKMADEAMHTEMTMTDNKNDETLESIETQEEAMETKLEAQSESNENSSEALLSKEAPREATLSEDAKDWLPEAPIAESSTEVLASETATEETESAHAAQAANPTNTGPVAFIADPYGFGVNDAREAQNLADSDIQIDDEANEAPLETAEIQSEEAAAQESALEELKENFGEEIPEIDPEQVEAEMMRLTQVMEEENAKQEKALEALADESPAQIKEEAEANLGEIFEQERLLDRDDVEEEAPLDLDQVEMESCLEALLFMSDKPLSAEKLQELLGPEMTLNRFQEALTSLKDRYQKAFHGIELVEVAGGYQFRTKPGRAVLAKKLARVQAQRLSGGAMETLAIVAYKQPALKDDIDKIRGVDSSHFIRGLLDKKLIRISGRSDLPGRPMLYSTSGDFLELFGLKDLSGLPTLREIENMVPSSQGGKGEEFEDPRVVEMRKLVNEMKTDTSVNLIYDPREDDKFLTEIREKVQSIPTSTPYLDEQKALEKEKLAAEKQAKAVAGLEAMMPAETAEALAEVMAASTEAPSSEPAPEANT